MWRRLKRWAWLGRTRGRGCADELAGRDEPRAEPPGGTGERASLHEHTEPCPATRLAPAHEQGLAEAHRGRWGPAQRTLEAAIKSDPDGLARADLASVREARRVWCQNARLARFARTDTGQNCGVVVWAATRRAPIDRPTHGACRCPTWLSIAS
jgi:hypothetical protein